MASELSWTQWLTMTGSFLFVIVLLVATLLLIKRLGTNYPVGSKKRIKIVDVQSLGARQKLLLVSVRDKELLIGLSPMGLLHWVIGNWTKTSSMKSSYQTPSLRAN